MSNKSLYRSDLLDQGIAFAPLAFNSFGQHGSEALGLHYQWSFVGKLAQRICPVPTFYLPDSVATHGQEATHSKRLEIFQFTLETVSAVGPRGHHRCLRGSLRT